MTKQVKGRIAQIMGAIVDVDFLNTTLPQMDNALEVIKDGRRVVLEVILHLGDGRVRTIAMNTTDGLVRGDEVIDTGASITVPVGNEVLGRIMNVLGEPIDGQGEIKTATMSPIHKEAPEFIDQATKAEVLYTGIKVVDLMLPYLKGGKIGLFGGAGVW